MSLIHATTAAHFHLARKLFSEYAAETGLDLAFQGFAEELSSLPGKYAPPHGRLLLAFEDSAAVGCVAMRPLGDGVSEMKRLFVRPTFRSTGLGRLLGKAIIAEARATGYRLMRLDTLATMQSAVKVYRALGFEEIRPYYPNPLSGVVYFECKLC